MDKCVKNRIFVHNTCTLLYFIYATVVIGAKSITQLKAVNCVWYFVRVCVHSHNILLGRVMCTFCKCSFLLLLLLLLSYSASGLFTSWPEHSLEQLAMNSKLIKVHLLLSKLTKWTGACDLSLHTCTFSVTTDCIDDLCVYVYSFMWQRCK